MKERFRRMEGVGGLHAIVAFSREDGSLVYCSEGLNADFSSEVAFRIRSEIEAAPAAVQRIVFTLGQERVIIVPSGDHFLALYVNQQSRMRTSSCWSPPSPPSAVRRSTSSAFSSSSTPCARHATPFCESTVASATSASRKAEPSPTATLPIASSRTWSAPRLSGRWISTITATVSSPPSPPAWP
jgi:hypothetical protein